MSKTGKFLKEKEEFAEQEQADIHPFSQVKPRKRKRYLITALVISTLTVYTLIGYLLFRDMSKEKTVEKKAKQKETAQKIETKKNSVKEFSLELPELEKNVKLSLLSVDIPPVSYYKKPENKLSKYNYYILKAKKAEINGKYIDAISFYKKAWKINRKDPEILYRIALLHFKIGYYKGTEKYLKSYLRIKKKDAKALLLLAKSYEKMGNSKKAKVVLEEAYFLYPENKDILENLGKLYEKENALIIAKDIYKILADMGYLEGKLGLARIYEKLNDKKSALKIYRELYQNPNISEQLRTKIENKIISLE